MRAQVGLQLGRGEGRQQEASTLEGAHVAEEYSDHELHGTVKAREDIFAF